MPISLYTFEMVNGGMGNAKGTIEGDIHLALVSDAANGKKRARHIFRANPHIPCRRDIGVWRVSSSLPL